MRHQILALIALLLIANPSAAQQDSTPERAIDILPDAVVVYSDSTGPAWWKVSKGESTVFILGLPPTKTLSGLQWDHRTLQRRLKGARLMLAPYTERSGFNPGSRPLPLGEAMARRVRLAFLRLGARLPPDVTMTMENVIRLRGLYVTKNGLGTGVHDEIYKEARRARVPIVTPPIYYHGWDAATLNPEDPEVSACIDAILKESEIDNSLVREVSRYWAVGDVKQALAIAPKPYNHVCHRLWPGHVERTIGFQTNAIAQSLDKPGKVIAVVYLYQLLDRNGILERLRAQGFEVSDPRKPLED